MQFVSISLNSPHSCTIIFSLDVYHLKAALQKPTCSKILYKSIAYDITVLYYSCSYIL